MCFSLFIVVSRALNTVCESLIPYCRHAVGDGHGSYGTANVKSIFANGCHSSCLAHVCYFFRNDHILIIPIRVIGAIASKKSNLQFLFISCSFLIC